MRLEVPLLEFWDSWFAESIMGKKISEPIPRSEDLVYLAAIKCMVSKSANGIDWTIQIIMLTCTFFLWRKWDLLERVLSTAKKKYLVG